MGQRCVHCTERDNGTRVLYAPNQCDFLFAFLGDRENNTIFHVKPVLGRGFT